MLVGTRKKKKDLMIWFSFILSFLFFLFFILCLNLIWVFWGAHWLQERFSLGAYEGGWVSLFILLAGNSLGLGFFLIFWLGKTFKYIKTLHQYVDDLVKGNLRYRLQESGDFLGELAPIVKSLSHIEKELRDCRKAVMKSQIQQEITLQNMDEGVISVDRQGQVNHINASAKKILGISLDNFHGLGKGVYELISAGPLSDFIESSLSSESKDEIEMTIDKGEVSERIFIVRSNPIFSVKSKYRGSIFVLLDVSELRKLERHRQEFVSNTSHELKTPLTAIKGYAETMQNPALSSKEDFRRFSMVIQDHADHLNSLIDDLLMLSELESGDSISGVQLISLDHLVRGAVEFCAILAEKKKIQVEVKSSLDLEVRGNPRLLTQALINLLDNAIKYSPEGKKVCISFKKEGKFIDLRVIDEGPGIPDTAKSRLFERFYRVDKGRSRESGGAGLGLSIVRHVMYAHGGEVGLESEMGKGSQFYLKIPTIDSLDSL